MKLTVRILAAVVGLCLAALGYVGTLSAAVRLPFKDVPKGNWAYDEVKYVYDRGVMLGVSEDEFDPNGSMSRAMAATVLHRIDESRIRALPEALTSRGVTDVSVSFHRSPVAPGEVHHPIDVPNVSLIVGVVFAPELWGGLNESVEVRVLVTAADGGTVTAELPLSVRSDVAHSYIFSVGKYDDTFSELKLTDGDVIPVELTVTVGEATESVRIFTVYDGY